MDNINYEKAYKEALNRAREEYKTHESFNGFRVMLLNIFPELEESEDEKIRKELITHCRNTRCVTEEGAERIVKWIAWLKKQVPFHLSHDDEIMIRQLTEYFITGKGLQNTNDTVVEWLEDIKRKLEKQGEQKPTDKIHLGKEYKCIASPRYSTFMRGKIYKPEDKFLCSLMNFCSDCFESIEDSEQSDFTSNADKVETKFKVGDWVVTSYGEVSQVISVDKDVDGYTLDNGNYFSGSWCKNYHLWTINDAKDGDVLVCPLPKGYENGEQIFIFKGINSRDYVDDCIEYYCRICKGVFYENKNGYMGTASSPLYPATKEQRDILFKKMKEAGYEWNPETK